MLDIKFIRSNVEKVREAIKNKKAGLDLDKLLATDERRRHLLGESELLKAEQNKRSRGPQSPVDLEELKALKEKIKLIESELKCVEEDYEKLMVQVPNIPSDDTPIGKDSNDNMEVFQGGKMRKFNFTPKDHIELAKSLDIIDFERGVKVAGFRGYFLKNEGAQLVMALMMFAFNKMVERGYSPMIPPTLVKSFALHGSGYFKGERYNSEVDEIYRIEPRNEEDKNNSQKEEDSYYKYLVGTAEPSLLAYYSDETLKEEDLPIRVSGFSQCYRSEIGSYGKDTKGLYRVHEFMKVEQVVISKADVEASDKLQKEMVAITREIHEDLGLPFRQIQICTGDMGLGKYKMFDTEAWLPGSNRWAETGSASNFLDWQARRLNIKYINKNGEKKFVYLLNNTALPSPRPFIAIMENYQTKKGTIEVPKVLRKYMGGIKEIKKVKS